MVKLLYECRRIPYLEKGPWKGREKKRGEDLGGEKRLRMSVSVEQQYTVGSALCTVYGRRSEGWLFSSLIFLKEKKEAAGAEHSGVGF